MTAKSQTRTNDKRECSIDHDGSARNCSMLVIV